MAQTNAAQLQGDVLSYLDETVLPIAQRRLVLHQFGDVKKIPKGRGNTWMATRYNRLPLPFAPLAEGIPAPAQPLTIQTVVGTAQQWGGQVLITDVAQDIIFHDPFMQAKRLIGYQIGECFERNDFLVCMGCTQVNYVNSRGSRASLVAGDVLDPYTVIRTQLALETLGAPYFGASTEPEIKGSVRDGSGSRASSNPRSNEHLCAVGHMLSLGDLRQNATVVTAWAYSDLNRLYNNEAGEWSAIRFCKSNLVPFFVGVANTGINPTPGTSGSLVTGSYFVQLTGVDVQNQYEQRIYQVSSSQSVTGPSGSITITTPNIAGFTFNAYIGTTSSPSNLALSVSGPSTGSMAGQAVQLPANSTIILTGTGLSQTPPAAPATGVTVYPTFVFGQGAFAVVELNDVQYFYLDKAEKIDPQNQTRVVAWKAYNGAMLINTQFMARIEAASAFTSTFT